MIQMLLGAFVVAAVVCAVACAVALQVFPWFRSGERKEGNFRPDQSAGGYSFDAKKKELKRQPFRVSASELPLVGGVAMILASVVAGGGVAFWLNLSDSEWELLGILLFGLIGYGLVGFIDDWQKVHRGIGITEVQKFAGVLLVSLATAVAFNRFITDQPLTARLAYPPYSEVPLLGQVLVHAHFAWIIFFILMTVTVATTTSLASDFADGMDGLAGGLLLSAALAFAVILLAFDSKAYWPLAAVSLAIAGACAGYLPFNWPSGWRNRQGGPKRRAKLIMGDTGSLALGGVLALVAVISRLELLMIIIGGVFVLEGLSALISARILVRFFRMFLYLERFGGGRGFAHTEFPLPFLATPMHHHYDLLNWDRRRIVYTAWLLGAVLGVLGVASMIAPLTWERYLARFVAILVLVAVWQLGPWTRSFFIGLALKRSDPTGSPRRLGLFYGYPFRLFGRPLYHCVDITSVRENVLSSPVEDLSLWQRMSVFDARSLLGYYCYRAGALEDADRIWDRLPKPNLEVRPEIAEMVAEVRHQIAARDANDDLAMVGARVSDSGTHAAHGPALPDDPNSSYWRRTAPPATAMHGTHLEPVEGGAPPGAENGDLGMGPRGPFWTATSWAAATGGPASPEEAARLVSNELEPVAQPASDEAPTASGEDPLSDTQPRRAVQPSSEASVSEGETSSSSLPAPNLS